MVGIINSGSSLYGVVAYNQQKVDDKTATILAKNRIIENMDSEKDLTFQLTLESFEPYLAANKRTKKPVVHISLNPAIEDNLTDEQLIEVAETYLSKMNFTDQPYIIYKHQDIDRHHLHIVTIRLDQYGNKKVSDSYEKNRNTRVCRELEKTFGLKVLGESEEENHYLPQKTDYNKGNIKQQIAATVSTLIKEYRFQTIGELNALLSGYNIQLKYIKGETRGKAYHGIIYQATNDQGETVSSPIKSSNIGKSVGFATIHKQITKNKEDFKTNKWNITTQPIIAKAMKEASGILSFQKELKKSNIGVLFRINDAGRIYGVTFIDYTTKYVYNGSVLGKEFSANVFHRLFENESDYLSSQNNTLSSTLIPEIPILPTPQPKTDRKKNKKRNQRKI